MIVGSGASKSRVLLKCEDCGKIREVLRTLRVLDKATHRCNGCWNRLKNTGREWPPRTPWNKGIKYTREERRSLREKDNDALV